MDDREMNKTPYNVKNCVTHHSACDCREYYLDQKIKELTKKIAELEADLITACEGKGIVIDVDGKIVRSELIIERMDNEETITKLTKKIAELELGLEAWKITAISNQDMAALSGSLSSKLTAREHECEMLRQTCDDNMLQIKELEAFEKKWREEMQAEIDDRNEQISKLTKKVAELKAYIVEHDICTCDGSHDFVCEKCEAVKEGVFHYRQLKQQITKLTKTLKEYDEVMGLYGGPDALMTGQSIVKDGIKMNEIEMCDWKKYYGEYKNVKFEIKTKKETQEMRGLLEHESSWCHYIFLDLDKQIPDKEIADKFWLEPKIYQSSSTSPKRVSYDYYESIINGLVFHGGCTWYSKESNEDDVTRQIKIGCDYQHLWDSGKDYSLEYVHNEVKETIESLLKITSINKRCGYCGKYIPESEFREDKPQYCIHCLDIGSK